MIHEYICGNPQVIKRVSRGRHHYDDSEGIGEELGREGVDGRLAERGAEGIEMTNIDVLV